MQAAILTNNIKNAEQQQLFQYSDQITTCIIENSGCQAKHGKNFLYPPKQAERSGSNTALYSIVRRLPGTPPPVVKHPNIEATHLPTFSAQVNNAWSFTSVACHPFLAWSIGTGVRIRTAWKYSNKNSILWYLFVLLFYRTKYVLIRLYSVASAILPYLRACI